LPSASLIITTELSYFAGVL